MPLPFSPLLVVQSLELKFCLCPCLWRRSFFLGVLVFTVFFFSSESLTCLCSLFWWTSILGLGRDFIWGETLTFEDLLQNGDCWKLCLYLCLSPLFSLPSFSLFGILFESHHSFTHTLGYLRLFLAELGPPGCPTWGNMWNLWWDLRVGLGEPYFNLMSHYP